MYVCNSTVLHVQYVESCGDTIHSIVYRNKKCTTVICNNGCTLPIQIEKGNHVRFRSNMGCCYSFCKEDSGPQGGEANERTHLLVDPVSNNTNIPRVHSDDYVNQYASSVPKKTDEQSALNRILHETAANVIDVGALDTHNLEQHEYMDRSRAYSKRIESGRIKLPEAASCLLKDIPAPERILAADPLVVEDQDLITEMLNKAVTALGDVKVEHKEDLVVPFLS